MIENSYGIYEFSKIILHIKHYKNKRIQILKSL